MHQLTIDSWSLGNCIREVEIPRGTSFWMISVKRSLPSRGINNDGGGHSTKSEAFWASIDARVM